MKYRALEAKEAKKKRAAERKTRLFMRYSESTSMAEFMIKTTLDGDNLTLNEKAAFWLHYMSNNYGKHCILLPVFFIAFAASAAFSLLNLAWLTSLTHACAAGNIAAVLLVSAGIALFLSGLVNDTIRSMSKQESCAQTDALMQKLRDFSSTVVTANPPAWTCQTVGTASSFASCASCAQYQPEE